MKWSTHQKTDRAAALTDKSPMPFGKHKGIPLESVPAGYLLWFAEQQWATEWPALLEYIGENRERLEDEAEEEDQERRKAYAEDHHWPDDDDVPM